MRASDPSKVDAVPWNSAIREPLRKTMRRRIGGRWAVSWQGYLLFLFVSVPLSILVVPAFFERSSWLTGIIVATVAYAVAGIVLYLASITVLRQRKKQPAPVLLVAFIGGLAWFARSAVFAAYLHYAGIPADATIRQRLVVGFFVGFLFVPAAAWLFATLDDFRQERQRLVNELVTRESMTQNSADYLEILRNDLWQHVTNTIAKPQLAAEGKAKVDLADELEQLATTVRTTSHAVANNVQNGVLRNTRIRFGDVLTLTARRPFALWPMPFLLFIAFIYIARFTPIEETMLAITTAGLYAAFLAVMTNNIATRSNKYPTIRYLASLIAQCTTPFAVAAALIFNGGQPNDAIKLGITVGIPLIILMILGGIARGINVAETDVLSDLRESISQSEITQEAQAIEERRILQDIATHMHGTITANLTAATMRLRISMKNGDVVAAQQAYAEACRQLDIDLRSAVLLEERDLPTLLTDIANAWTGIATITINSTHLPDLNTRIVRDIVDVVTEAINNAIRHGNAQHITVSITENQDALHLTVIDDGSQNPQTSSTESSLGFALYKRISPNTWSFTRTPVGTSELSLRITN